MPYRLHAQRQGQLATQNLPNPGLCCTEEIGPENLMASMRVLLRPEIRKSRFAATRLFESRERCWASPVSIAPEGLP